MKKIIKTRAVSDMELTSAVPTLSGATDALHEHLRPLIRELVEQLVRAELEAVLQAGPYARCPDGIRRGYRHAARDRTLTTSCGPSVISVPRARLFDEAGRRRRNGSRSCCRGITVGRERSMKPSWVPTWRARIRGACDGRCSRC